VAEEMVEREREVVGRNLAARWSVSLRFLSDTLSFSRGAAVQASFIVSKMLRAKITPSLERATVLRRCFVLEEPAGGGSGGGGGTDRKNSSRAVPNAAAMAKLAAMPVGGAASASRGRGQAKDKEDDEGRDGLEGREALRVPIAARTPPVPSPQIEQLLYSPRQARGPITTAAAASAPAAVAVATPVRQVTPPDKNPFGAAPPSTPTAPRPVAAAATKPEQMAERARVSMSGSASRSLSSLDRKPDEPNPFCQNPRLQRCRRSLWRRATPLQLRRTTIRLVEISV
jgi:hypothetical protein